MIWKRYILKEIIKVFTLVLFGFFFLYCVFDYSLHMQDFLKDKKIQLLDFFIYYGHLFIKRAELLVPLAMLIATIKVLSSFNSHRELLALQVAGLSFKKLLRPFFLLGAVCTLYSFVSVEFFLPTSLAYLDNFHNSHFKHSEQRHKIYNLKTKDKLHTIPLKDRSKVVYQYFDSAQDAYFDVIWIRSPGDLWRIKYLKIGDHSPQGKYVDHFVRDSQGFFEKAQSYIFYEFSDLKWDRETVFSPLVPYENLKTSDLIKTASLKTTTSYEKSEVMTNFFYKCAMPLLPLLVILGAAPFCVRYSRTQMAFFTYATGIFGFITFYLIMNAAVILGENHVFSPFVAIFTPFIFCCLVFGWKFYKTV